MPGNGVQLPAYSMGCRRLPEPGAFWEIESALANTQFLNCEAHWEMESSPRPHRIAGVDGLIKHAKK